MIERLPPLVAGCCLLIYWGAVVRKAIRVRRKERHGVNLIPREQIGRWLRVIWIPVIVAWCIQPWHKVTSSSHASSPGVGLWWMTLAFAGAALCVAATVATFSCWREMGKSWRIGIDPGEKTKLVFTGPYRFVRHPIYTLSILLILGTLATTPTALMLVLTVLHIGLLQFEARREEAYLLEKHGSEYADYRSRVGRFFPRAASGS
jgi:protein-S-isoprenylcysteine O-methyltransferase Ste14